MELFSSSSFWTRVSAAAAFAAQIAAGDDGSLDDYEQSEEETDGEAEERFPGEHLASATLLPTPELCVAHVPTTCFQNVCRR